MMPLLTPVADVLMHRGILDSQSFLAPSTWGDLPSPFQIEGVEQGVDHILAALKANERILIFGDYDCDGVLSSALLAATLRKLGGQVEVRLPHRDDGYGLTVETVHRFSRNGTDLLIAIDNGINAAVAVRLAVRLGISVVIVDHHQIETPAETTSIWSDEYCAAGLGLMLCRALLERSALSEMDRIRFLAGLSRLAAIASVADCVPLTGATRTITRIGLAELAVTRHAGLRQLLSLAGVRFGEIPTSEEIAFRVAPRINAAGRVDHPELALRMLCAPTGEEQMDLANNLDRLNKERRSLERSALTELSHQVGDGKTNSLVVYGAGWKKGIAGILASRAAVRYGVPSFVLVRDERTGMATGSGRSVRGISLIDALRSTGHLLVRFGGHKQAAGVTLMTENIPAFREAFDAFIGACPVAPVEAMVTDAVLDFRWLGKQFNEQLRNLGPFGIGNATPVFQVRHARVRSANHNFVLVEQDGREVKARADRPVEGTGTALVAMNGSTASLLELRPS